MQEKKVSIIIPNYNGLFFLKKCIRAIERQTYKNIETVVVDNNSTDQTVIYLKKKYPKVKIIKNKLNNGFAKANNQGAIKAIGDYLFFLNNDTELINNTVEILLKSYKPKSILSAYQIPSRNTKIQGRAGAGMDIFGYPYSNQSDKRKTKLFYADGAALFLKKSDFIELGMFDEQLFMFIEDVDLSWRAQLRGFTIISCWDAKLYHYHGGTAKLDLNSSKQYISSYFRRYLNERNVIRNVIKNYSLAVLIIILPLLLFFHIGEITFLLVTRNLKVVKCYFAAYWWNIKNINDTLKSRASIQKNRVVSDWEILKRVYWNYSKLLMFIKIGIPKFQ